MCESKEICSHNCACQNGNDCHGEGVSNLWDTYESERSFKEDYEHENGQYINICSYCEKEFMGHKRRVVCKSCQNL